MARHIRVPGIVDVVLVSDPAEIRALNDHAKIDRNFIPRGPLINRLIVGRIRHWLKIMGQFLPSPVPRTVEAALETPLVNDQLSAGTVIMLQLASAGLQAPDAEMVFMRDHWNACPARAFVTELLLAVWRRSLEEP